MWSPHGPSAGGRESPPGKKLRLQLTIGTSDNLIRAEAADRPPPPPAHSQRQNELDLRTHHVKHPAGGSEKPCFKKEVKASGATRGEEGSCPRRVGGIMACQHLNFRLLASSLWSFVMATLGNLYSSLLWNGYPHTMRASSDTLSYSCYVSLKTIQT